jgi:hypothetical protein
MVYEKLRGRSAGIGSIALALALPQRFGFADIGIARLERNPERTSTAPPAPIRERMKGKLPATLAAALTAALMAASSAGSSVLGASP